MYEKRLLLGICGCLFIDPLSIQAHNHTYIVEEAPQPIVIVQQQAPAPMVNVITVEAQPPEDILEQVPACPGDNYVWQRGHWHWNGSWVWQNGFWVQRPYERGIYVPGYWKKSHHHWEWVEPHWK